MTPAIVTIANEDDLDLGGPPAGLALKTGVARTLLLAPASLAANEIAMAKVLAEYPRTTSDLQMMDRVSAGLVNLPEATYDLVLLLVDPKEPTSAVPEPVSSSYTAPVSVRRQRDVLNRTAMGIVVESMKPDALLQVQDGSGFSAHEEREAILAGLIIETQEIGTQSSSNNGGGFKKPNFGGDGGMVKLSFGKKSKNKNLATLADSTPAGVGFVDMSDDLDMLDADDDDEFIDENDLLTEEEKGRKLDIPEECAPKPGKRRRACKDCSCGLAERLAAEDSVKRERTSATVAAVAVKLDSADLAEVDFTVQGKVGSCGNCSLGDAFRCDGCPYIGLPPFKPGEEVRLLKNDIQL